MQMQLQVKDVTLDKSTRRSIERRVRLAVGRHLASISKARVTLSPANVVHGSRTKRCEIHLQLREGQDLRSEDHDEDASAAALRAAHRLGQRLDRRKLSLESFSGGLR